MPSPPRTLAATRYVTPLREGGSLPAIVEADDEGLYVLKFHGAGQGSNALVAELLAGELARAAGLAVPELAFMNVDPDLARSEPDPEIQDLIRKSPGLNLALDYLPGAAAFDPVAGAPEPAIASAIVWFDAFVTNVDRTPRNTNMLIWHRRLWLIDHGAAFYFHHAGGPYDARAQDAFPLIRDHVLLPYASELEAVDGALAGRLDDDVLGGIVSWLPDSWLAGDPFFPAAEERRQAYLAYLKTRLAEPRHFVKEALRARSGHL